MSCSFVNPETRVKCQNKLGKYINFCWLHTDLVQNIQIKKSQIPNSGYGLYAGSKGFKKGEKIALYGTPNNHVLEKTLNAKCESAKDFNKCWGDYVLCHGKHCWDGRNPKSTISRYANDCHGSSFKCNSHFEIFKGVPWLVATRNIPPGQEIFCSYGKDYWIAKGL